MTTPKQPTRLIRSKLTRPPVPPGFVDRPRLLDRLDEALEHRVMLLSAPPGFGKSTVVDQWLERRNLPAAWVSLDRNDSDPERFVRYLVEAVEGSSERRLPETRLLLDSQQAPPFDYLLEVLASELAAGDEQLIVALEDYHAVGSEEVHRLVESVVTDAPSLRILVMTRRDPPWPLAHWRARAWLHELRSRELRFTAEETRQFFAAGRPVPLSTATVEAIQERLEGWGAGLRLLKLSLRGVQHPEERALLFSGGNRIVADYLVDEVLAVQPPEVREFLATTASLPRFSAGLCDHVLANLSGLPPAGAILDHLESDNVFLVRLDEEGQWYRYHHFFRDLLLQHLAEGASASRRAAIDCRAAEWFAAEGLIEEALQHWIDAGELDAAARLLIENLNAVIEADLSRRTLARLLDLFPAGAERGRPALLIAHAYAGIVRGDIPGIADLVGQARELLPRDAGDAGGTQPELLVRYLDMLTSTLLYWGADPGGCLRLVSGALDDVPVGEWGYPHALAALYKAGALALTGKREEGLRFLEDAISAGGANRERRVGEFLFMQAVIHLYAGETDAAGLVARRILAVDEAVPTPRFWLGWAHWMLGVVAYERNLLEEAEGEFSQVLEMRFEVGTRNYHSALIGMCLVACARGDESGAARWGAEVQAYPEEVGDPMSRAVARSFDARMRWLAGEKPVWTSAPPEGADSTSFFLEVPSLTYADLLLADRDGRPREDTLSFIERCLERAEAHHSVRQAIALSLLRAQALDARGERDSALELLAATVRRAAPLGMVRTFVDRGPRLARLLESLAARGDSDDYLRLLLSAFGGSARDRLRSEGSGGRGGGYDAEMAQAALAAGLSIRELDVLELLAERLSNKEIAARLCISPETVKMHAQNLYRKLDVHGRREAVAKALADGLLRSRF